MDFKMENNKFEINRILSFALFNCPERLMSYEIIRKFAKRFMYCNNEEIKCALCNETIGKLNLQTIAKISSSCCFHTCIRHLSFTRNENVALNCEGDFSYEECRLLSFIKIGWCVREKNSFNVSAIDLAKSGFVCLNDEDATKCYFCQLEIRGWEDGDIVDSEHRHWNPQCLFLKGSEHIKNIPLYSIPSLRLKKHNNGIIPYINENFDGWETAINVSNPKHEKYRLFAERLKTYANWPYTLSQSPEDLAKAGFFYTGRADRVICYHCSGGLTDWLKNSDPWEEHATYFDNCGYLKLNKTMDFIKNVKRSKCDAVYRKSCSEIKCSMTNETEEIEKHQCKICFKNAISIAYLPCGHTISCVNCASQTKLCEYCRKKKFAFVKIYLS